MKPNGQLFRIRKRERDEISWAHNDEWALGIFYAQATSQMQQGQRKSIDHLPDEIVLSDRGTWGGKLGKFTMLTKFYKG